MNIIFEGSNPLEISMRWLAEAEKTEINDDDSKDDEEQPFDA